MPESRVAIVTGAGSGIGRAVSQLLAAAGYHVAIVGRTLDKLRETAALVAGHRGAPEPLSIAADVAKAGSERQIVDQILRQWGRIDALINNAAIAPESPIEGITDGLLESMFATNTFGPARLIAAAWPAFVRQKSGCVVNVSSIAAFTPFPGLAAYAASKGALDSLTRSIDTEGRGLGIRAFSVAPGAVETAMLREIVSEADLPREKTLEPALVASIIVDCVLGRRERDIGTVIQVPSP